MQMSCISRYLCFNVALGSLTGTVTDVHTEHGKNTNTEVVNSYKEREAG